MVTRGVAGMLLGLAARRWPAGLRDELRREWLAELDVLAADHRHAQMVLFAVSLAVSRPAAAPLVDRSPMTSHVRDTAAVLLSAPIACLGLLLAGWTAAGLLINVPQLERLGRPILAALVLILAWVVGIQATRWGSRTALVGPVPVVLGVMVPLPLAPLLIGWSTVFEELLSGMAVWVPGLTLVLFAAARLARAGRIAAAWTAGVAGALVVFDLAVVANFLPMWNSLDFTYSPLWFPIALTGSAFGLSHPTAEESSAIVDAVVGMPQMCVIFAAYALSYVISAMCPRPVHFGEPTSTFPASASA